MTKEELGSILERCCAALRKNKDVDIRVHYIDVNDAMTPWGEIGTEYRYTLRLVMSQRLRLPKDFTFRFYNVEEWKKTEGDILAFSKNIVEHLWKKIKIYKID